MVRRALLLCVDLTFCHHLCAGLALHQGSILHTPHGPSLRECQGSSTAASAAVTAGLLSLSRISALTSSMPLQLIAAALHVLHSCSRCHCQQPLRKALLPSNPQVPFRSRNSRAQISGVLPGPLHLLAAPLALPQALSFQSTQTLCPTQS